MGQTSDPGPGPFWLAHSSINPLFQKVPPLVTITVGSLITRSIFMTEGRETPLDPRLWFSVSLGGDLLTSAHSMLFRSNQCVTPDSSEY